MIIGDKLNHGGALRCCIQSWTEVAEAESHGPGAEQVRCRYCGAVLVRGSDGEWRWDREQSS